MLHKGLARLVWDLILHQQRAKSFTIAFGNWRVTHAHICQFALVNHWRNRLGRREDLCVDFKELTRNQDAIFVLNLINSCGVVTFDRPPTCYLFWSISQVVSDHGSPIGLPRRTLDHWRLVIITFRTAMIVFDGFVESRNFHVQTTKNLVWFVSTLCFEKAWQLVLLTAIFGGSFVSVLGLNSYIIFLCPFLIGDLLKFICGKIS